MEIDLKGKRPKPKSLQEANEIIKALWQDLCRLKERSKTNSKNSSLPPSRDKSSKNKYNIRRTERRKRNPKNRGSQPGHEKHERRLLPTKEVDKIIRCMPGERCHCGGTVIKDCDLKRRHQQYEFPVIKPFVTEYQIYTSAQEVYHEV